MRRVFAELENLEDNAWGYSCPRCKAYFCEEHPDAKSKRAHCCVCSMDYLVTFIDGEQEAVPQELAYG